MKSQTGLQQATCPDAQTGVTPHDDDDDDRPHMFFYGFSFRLSRTRQKCGRGKCLDK